ncbi:DUF554 domain-containing protein [Clostridioides mangenotii]|uniref:DUF554 domain-containing protein n=1 Tax=Metaclostridioides mangenotii TaxID=1540 RepID=UPI00214A1086|nr:DUF554 domain-containing protein [Clostridioides mangenotii]MCR1953646.1 DUF554 domain-containing protein [Clostridioides mangenotii]
MLGTIVNSLAIAIGCLVGLVIKKGIPDRVSKTIMSGLALCVIYIGIEGSLKGENTLITVVCIAVGGLIGEIIDIDNKINKLGDFLQNKLSKDKDSETSIAKGFVTTSLIYCVGAMAIVGALESGLTGNHQTLFTKALLDGISAIIFTTTLGIGVIFSSVAVFLYQGLITIGASILATLLSDAVVTALTAVGSLLIIGIGLNLLEVTKIKVANLLPAVFLPIIFGMLNLL